MIVGAVLYKGAGRGCMTRDRLDRSTRRGGVSDTEGRRAEMLDAVGAFERVFEASSDAMKLIDLDGRIVRWNRASRDVCGWEEDEVLGQVLPHIPSDMRLKVIQDIRSIAGSGREQTREAAILRKDGTVVSVALTVVPYLDAESNPAGVVSIGRAVRGTEDAGLPTDFSLAFARALRTPLSALVGYAQLLLHADIVEDISRRTRTVRAIEENLAVVVELLDEIEMATEARPGVNPVDLEEIALAPVIADAARVAEAARPDRVFVLDLDTGTGDVRIGRRRAERALAGLMILAADHAGPGGEVSVVLANPRASALVSVEATPAPGRSAVTAGERESRDTDSFVWHAASVVVASAGGTLTRFEGRDDTVAYRMMVPVPTQGG